MLELLVSTTCPINRFFPNFPAIVTFKMTSKIRTGVTNYDFTPPWCNIATLVNKQTAVGMRHILEVEIRLMALEQ